MVTTTIRAEAIATLSRSPRNTGVFVDFDGTLAPIVDDPPTAQPNAKALEALYRVAERFSRTAVISGRPVEFLRDRLALTDRDSPLLAVGHYGFERARATGEIQTPAGIATWQRICTDVAKEASDAAPKGVFIEHKPYGVGFHWRTVPEAENETLELARTLQLESGLELRESKMAVELVPPIGMDKGTVVISLGAGLGAICFIGDDISDIPAFLALRRLESHTQLRGVAVAVRSAETPAELIDHADLVLDGTAGVEGFLSELADAVPEILNMNTT